MPSTRLHLQSGLWPTFNERVGDGQVVAQTYDGCFNSPIQPGDHRHCISRNLQRYFIAAF